MDRLKIVLFYVFLLAVFSKVTGCKQDSPTLFERMSGEHTGINFVITVKERPGNNILESEFFYNGAGVAVGDINNDGYTLSAKQLQLLGFSGNLPPSESQVGCCRLPSLCSEDSHMVEATHKALRSMSKLFTRPDKYVCLTA